MISRLEQQYKELLAKMDEDHDIEEVVQACPDHQERHPQVYPEYLFESFKIINVAADANEAALPINWFD